MASIKNHFEQRADLDAFWSADVDFSRDRLGLRNPAQEHVRQTSRPRVLTGTAGKECIGEDQEADMAEESWIETAHKQGTWDFEVVRFNSAQFWATLGTPAGNMYSAQRIEHMSLYLIFAVCA